MLALMIFALAVGAILYAAARAGMVGETLKGPGSGQVISLDWPVVGQSGSLGS